MYRTEQREIYLGTTTSTTTTITTTNNNNYYYYNNSYGFFVQTTTTFLIIFDYDFFLSRSVYLYIGYYLIHVFIYTIYL